MPVCPYCQYTVKYNYGKVSKLLLCIKALDVTMYVAQEVHVGRLAILGVFDHHVIECSFPRILRSKYPGIIKHANTFCEKQTRLAGGGTRIIAECTAMTALERETVGAGCGHHRRCVLCQEKIRTVVARHCSDTDGRKQHPRLRGSARSTHSPPALE